LTLAAPKVRIARTRFLGYSARLATIELLLFSIVADVTNHPFFYVPCLERHVSRKIDIFVALATAEQTNRLNSIVADPVNHSRDSRHLITTRYLIMENKNGREKKLR